MGHGGVMVKKSDSQSRNSGSSGFADSMMFG